MSLTTDINAYWKFDESSGDAIDMVSGRTLVNYGTATYVPAKINNGVNTDHSGKYLMSGTLTSFAGGQHMSLSFWYKPADPLTYWTIIRCSAADGKSQWQIESTVDPVGPGYDVTGLIFVTSETGLTTRNSETYRSILTSDTWHHIAVTYDGTQAAKSRVHIYVNGVDQIWSFKDAAYASIYTADSVLRVGNSNGVTAIFDELGYWSRTLTPTEVQQLYNGGNGIPWPLRIGTKGPFVTHYNE